LKRYEEAIEKYRRHLELFPENYVAWGNMGMLFVLLLNKKEALKCLYKALSINPDYKIAKANLRVIENSSKQDLKRIARNRPAKWRT
jgi:tetratricopeptide (TPR) repeat protein